LVSVGQSCITVLDKLGTGADPGCQRELTLTGNQDSEERRAMLEEELTMFGLSAKLFKDATEAKDGESAVSRTERLNAGKKTS